jgi:dihydroorotase
MNYPAQLLIQAPQVICHSTNQDGPAQITTSQGQIDHVKSLVPDMPIPHLEFHDAILLPGLIDLHAHPACQGSVWGVVPDEHMLPFGVTTVMSQGDAGADNWQAYQEHTIEASRTHVLMAMNPAKIAESTPAGCFEKLDDIDIARCIVAINAGGDRVRAVSVNTSRNCCGNSDPREVLRRGLQIAEETNLPLLYGMRPPEDWTFREQMELLRPGDIVTYCFRSQPHNIMAGGTVHSAIQEARQRGILFDVGHGGAAFDFEVASAAIAEGFLPDTISTDLHVQHLEHQEVHTLPRTMSKLRAAGMEPADIFTAVTTRPAAILQSSETLGCLRPGAVADLVALQTSEQPVVFSDVCGNQRAAIEWIPVCTVRQGDVLHLSEMANVSQRSAD